MTFGEWKFWTKSLPWKYKWFIILILIRPIIDQLYELKKISPFFSPLYWAGILTIVFSMIVIIITKSQRSQTRPYKIFLVWSVLYLITLTLNYTLRGTWSIGTLATYLKYITIVFLFFFISRTIRNEYDLLGILTTFLYSCFVIILMILFTGTWEIKGLYDSVQNIAFYITLGYLANTYIYFKKSETGKGNIWRYYAGLFLVLASFINLQHIATIAVVLVVTLVFLFYSRRISKLVMITSFSLIFAFWIGFGDLLVKDYIAPQLDTEIEAWQGNAESARLFHGRMSRWEYFIPQFFSLNPIAISFGSAYGLEMNLDLLTISNIHNDFLRILLASGIIGLLLYLYFLYLIFKRVRYLKTAEKFLVTSSLAIILLYSITTYPTIYAGMLYVLLSVFAFATKPVYQYSFHEKDSHSK